MTISSIDQVCLTSPYTGLLKNSSITSSTAASTAQTDFVTLSSEAQQLPQPPHTMDFESMTDDEIKDYVQQMYAVTGSLPGGMEGSVDSLDEENLSQIRSLLTEMSQSGSVAPEAQANESSGMTGEDLKSLLTMMLLNMQSSLTSSEDSSENSLFPDITSDYLTQAMLSISSSEDENSQSVLQQALAAYNQNILSI